MTIKWSTAALNYRVAADVQQREREKQAARALCEQSTQDEGRRQTMLDIERGANELELFMRTEGKVALELLRASNRHLNFGEENEGGGHGVVYFIDGNGLQQSIEAMGTWTIYSSDVPKPRLSRITSHQAVAAAVHYGGKKATEVVSWLRSELDKIASSAPVVQDREFCTCD